MGAVKNLSVYPRSSAANFTLHAGTYSYSQAAFAIFSLCCFL
jgi:hypothetical protein